MLFLDHYPSLTISFLTTLVKAAQEAGKGALMRFCKDGLRYEVSYFVGDISCGHIKASNTACE